MKGLRFAAGVWVGVLVCLGAGVAGAEIRLPKLWSDHAVLQRGVPIRVWGWASPGAKLTVGLHGQSVPAVADRLGEWTAWLMPEVAGGPYTLTVRGEGAEGSKEVSDLLVGDVWFASGQSNMEMPLAGFGPGTPVKNGAAEIAAATNPRLRLLVVEKRGSEYPLNDLTTTWTLCTPETAAKFSAVAYFFGREIAADEHVAVGLIDATWGGTPADSWVSMETLGNEPGLLPAFAARAGFAAELAQEPERMAAEQREDAEAKRTGRPAPAHGWHPAQVSWMPAGLYNGMVAPVTKLSVRGFLWYQGETNSSPERAPAYATLFQGLIRDWRERFGQGDLPFVYAQISSFRSPGERWGLLRDAQRRALSLRRTAMAVTLDVGDPGNVHPSDKQTVGARLALGAKAVAYGHDVAYASPLFREVTTAPGGMRVWFDHAEGLTARGGGAVEGFEVAGEDHRFVAATAKIEGESVVLASPAVAQPRYVRYAWNGVAPPALYNAAGLPASTFTSEEHPAP